MKTIIVKGKIGIEEEEEDFGYITHNFAYIQKLNPPSRHGHKNREPSKIYLDEMLDEYKDKTCVMILVVD